MARQAVGSPTALSGTLGECIGEFFGTLVLVLFGDGSVAAFKLFGPATDNWLIVALGWGLAIMLGIYVTGAISGGHINPAVTLAFAIRKKIGWEKVAPYMIAQLVGAFVAAAIVYFVYQGAITNLIGTANIADPVRGAGGVFYTSKAPFVGTFGAFGDEFLGTAMLVGLIFAITDRHNQPVQANLNPLIIGLLFAAIGLSIGLNTGFAINPARDFGPRLFMAIPSGGYSFVANNYYFWIPIVAPLLGGVAGAFIYEFTVGKVIEARHLAQSGDTVTKGEAVREPTTGD